MAKGLNEPTPTRADRYLLAAKETGRWIIGSAIEGPDGRTWPKKWPYAGDGSATDPALYHGDAGVALFLADLVSASGDNAAANALQDAASSLERSLSYERHGLYSGLAGMAFASNRAAAVLGDAHGTAGSRMLDNIVQSSVRAGEGIEWPVGPDGRGPWQELFHGTAGIGLTLLEMERVDGAVAAGRRLLDLPIPAKAGHWWKSRPDDLKPAPNIAHGTAGVSYFLATLALRTGVEAFAEAAIDGARYLLSIARTDDQTCAVHHHEVDGTDLFTLGWCSGPPGLGCLFLRLYQVTRDDDWLEWARRAARTVTDSRIPVKLYPGFWDNAAQCCGSAGVVDFFLGLHEVTGDASYRDFAFLVLDDLLDRASVDEQGMRWHNVEFRNDPPELPAQTGYMQGAAGIGCTLLRAYRHLSGQPLSPWLPSWPFGG